MRHLRTRTKVGLVLLVTILVLSGLFAAYQYFSATNSKQIGYGVIVTGNHLPSNIQASLTQIHAPFSPTLATNVSPTYQISPSGPLSSSVTIQLPLTRPVPSSGHIFVMSADSPQGSWTPLAASLSPDGKSVSVSVNHLSIFDPILLNISAMFNTFKEKFLDALVPKVGLTAKPPECPEDKQIAARQDGYSITSSSSKTVYWCFEVENGKRVLKVVNNEIYPLVLKHPGLTVAFRPIQPLLHNLEELYSRSLQEELLLPNDEIDFYADIPSGKLVGVQTSFDVRAELLVGLEAAVGAISTLFELFGKTLAQAIKALDTLFSTSDCYDASSKSVTAPKDFSPSDALRSCLSPKNLKKAFGDFWGGFASVFFAVSDAMDFLISGAFGDAENLLKHDLYQIFIRHVSASASPCPASAGTCIGIKTGDMDADGIPDQVGVTWMPDGCASGTPSSCQMVAHIILDSGAVINAAIPWNFSGAWNVLALQFMGLSDANGDGRDEIFLRIDGSCMSCSAVVPYELHQGVLQPLVFPGVIATLIGELSIGWGGNGGGFTCRVTNGKYQVLYVTWPLGTNMVTEQLYQANSDGTEKLIKEDNTTYTTQQENAASGAHCSGLSVS